MAPARIAPADLADWLPAGGRVLVTGATGESLILAEAVMDAGEALGPMTFTGIFIPGVNNHDYLANADCRVETYFVTPPLQPELGRSEERRGRKECVSTCRSRWSAEPSKNNTKTTHDYHQQKKRI